MLPKENVGGAPKKRLREDLLDLCLSNVITGQRAQRLFESGEASGASGLKDLAKYRGPKAKRDIMRRAMKHNDWPKMYMANLPTLCPQTKEEIVTQVPILLIHELLDAIYQKSACSAGMFCWEALGPKELEHLRFAARQLGVHNKNLVGVALWGDGVPYSHDRTKTLEMLSATILTAKDKVVLPLACIPKHWMVKATWDAVLEVVKWSFQCCASGLFPAVRHDGQPWKEKSRAKLAGQKLVQAVLLQVKGDWSFYKNTLYLPGWKLGSYSLLFCFWFLLIEVLCIAAEERKKQLLLALHNEP